MEGGKRVTTPTQSEKRIAIAEHFGWIWGQRWGKKSLRFVAPLGYRSQNWRCSDGEVILPLGHMSEQDRKESIIDGLPDYFSDLNATHEAENALSDEQYQAFGIALTSVSEIKEGLTDMASCRAILSVPASLRAEALYQVLCKTPTP